MHNIALQYASLISVLLVGRAGAPCAAACARVQYKVGSRVLPCLGWRLLWLTYHFRHLGLSRSSCRTITLHERVVYSLVTLVLDFSSTGVQDLLVQVCFFPPARPEELFGPGSCLLRYSSGFAAKTVCLSSAFRESDADFA